MRLAHRLFITGYAGIAVVILAFVVLPRVMSLGHQGVLVFVVVFGLTRLAALGFIVAAITKTILVLRSTRDLRSGINFTKLLLGASVLALFGPCWPTMVGLLSPAGR